MKNLEVLRNSERIALLDMAGLAGIKLSYAVAQNAKTLGEASLVIKSKLNYPEEYIKMRDEYREHFKAHALKDTDGKFVIEEGKYKLDLEKEEEYKKLIQSKNSENQLILEKAQKIEEEYNLFLEEDSNVKLETVKLEDFSESINPVQMDALSFMVDEFKG